MLKSLFIKVAGLSVKIAKIFKSSYVEEHLQKAASVPLLMAHSQSVASLKLFYSYCFCRCSSELG